MSNINLKHTHDAASAPERIQKLLARHNLGSRREIEILIAQGKIKVNGRIVQLGDKAIFSDEIFVNQKKVKISKEIKSCALLYHKPCGVLVTRKNQDNRATIFSVLPKPPEGRWIAVGRLDCNTSGLLVICNDGELAGKMMHPSSQLEREYRVRVRGEVNEDILQRLREGVMLGERQARFDMVEACPSSATEGGVNHWFRVVLREGRNREVRRLWESQGLEVSRLVRNRFSFLQLDIPLQDWRWLASEELDKLYREVGLPTPLLCNLD